jgi:hypothetical protein
MRSNPSPLILIGSEARDAGARGLFPATETGTFFAGGDRRAFVAHFEARIRSLCRALIVEQSGVHTRSNPWTQS